MGGLIREADLILALDWIDPAGTMRQACLGELPRAKVILGSLDQYSHNGWSMDHQALPAADLNVLASRLREGVVALSADRVRRRGTACPGRLRRRS